MTTITTNREFKFYVGESRFITITPGVAPTGALRSGQTITSVTWTVESPLTVAAGSEEIITTVQASDTCRARIIMGSTPGRYSVTAAMTTSTPTETIVETVICVVSALPT